LSKLNAWPVPAREAPINGRALSVLLIAAALFAWLGVVAALNTWGPRAGEFGMVLQ
jgi:hypothetical protein